MGQVHDDGAGAWCSLRWLAGSWLASAAFLGAACKVGPDYEPPEPAMPDAWHHELIEGLAEGETGVETWWRSLNDPQLDELIQRAARGNLDLERAFARIKEARAFRGVAKGEYYPDLDGTGAAQRQRLSEGLQAFPGGQTDNVFSIGAEATWEIDVWGRIGRSVESADATLMASIENYRDVLVLLYADVALSYVDVRTLQARIRYAQDNISTQRDTLQLTRDRFEAQIAPELDVQQAELTLSSTEATLPPLRRALANAIHRLGVLMGEHPQALYELLGEAAPIPAAPDEVAVGIPADLLRQRPDIRRAERDLAAQTARIGVATADLYPAFSIFGSLGLEATSNLFDSANKTWTLGPQFRWNLFDGGRVRNLINVEDARTEQAYFAYEETVLFALEDVENALAAYVEEQRRVVYLERSVTAAERSVELVKTLYRTGLTDFQNVRDSERSLAVQQDLLAESQGLVVQALVLLYRALGGGWDPDPPKLHVEIRDQQENGEPIL